jgi:hypothetical protein
MLLSVNDVPERVWSAGLRGAAGNGPLPDLAGVRLPFQYSSKEIIATLDFSDMIRWRSGA